MISAPTPARRILTGPFISLWVSIALGYSQYHLLQPVIPLVVVDLGGDAALVGLTALAFGLPSILVRPLIGRVVDQRGGKVMVGIGTAVLGATAIIYAVPAIAAIFFGRIVQGIGWAALNTGGYSLLARLAPAERRGEASGYYAVAPALAQLLMPGIGILLYQRFGSSIPLVLASVAALVGLVVISLASPPSRPAAANRRPASTEGLTERSAILPMALEAVNSSTQSIFTFFMPIIVLGLGYPIETLTVYYPAYGIVMVLGRLLSPRMSDSMGRRPTLLLGFGLALFAVLVALLALNLVVLMVAGCVAALSGALLTPTLSALTIDRAPGNRIGAAVATYSLGYQIGLGMGGALWGVVLDAAGAHGPLLIAATLQGLVIVFVHLTVLRAIK